MTYTRHLFALTLGLSLAGLAQSASLPNASSVHPPLVFEANRGQTSPNVRYLAHGGAFTLFLTDAGPVVSLGKKDAAAAVVQLRWLHANPQPSVRGEGSQSGVVNYLLGRDSAQWHTDIPTFSRVRYPAMYSGVDVVFHGSNHALEYDLQVKAGADPSQIAFRVEGARPALDRNGDLILNTPNGPLTQHRPVAYQVIAGVKHSVSASYRIDGATVGFDIGQYDRRRELIIDPTLSYATYIGGNQQEWSWSIAIDGSNQAYIIGQTYSTDYPIKNAYQSTRKGTSGSSVVITKFAANGGSLIYSTYFGYNCDPGSIAVDRTSAVYFTASCDPKHVPGKILGSPNMSVQQGFLGKLNPSGKSLAWALIYGGQHGGSGGGIALDSSFHAYLAGATSSVDFPTTPGAYQTSFGSGSEDAFVVKVKSDGSGFAYSTFFPNASAGPIAVNNAGEAYFAGITDGGIPTTPGVVQPSKPAFSPCDPGDQSCDNYLDGFVAKLNATGSNLVYSTYLGGNFADGVSGIAVDKNGYAYVTGSTISSNFPTTAGAFQRTLPCCGFMQAFVSKLNPTATAFSYSTFLGGSGGSNAGSIAINSQGQAFVTGSAGAGFPVKNAIQSSNHGYLDVFVTRLWASGGGLHWSTYIGGSGLDYGNSVRLDGAGNPYVTGSTTSSNFPTTPGAYRRTFRGGIQDSFVFKITN